MRDAVVAILILCVVTAGCISPVSDDQEEMPSRALSVEEVDSVMSTESVVEYPQLSADQQDVFVSAVNSEDDNAWIQEEVSYEVWIDYEYVAYNDSFYKVYVSTA